MYFKKLYFFASLLCLSEFTVADQKTISLQCPLLKVADNAGIFHGPIVDILQTRIDIVKLIQGEKTWSGAVMKLHIADSDQTITIYCQRPEILYGATFVALSPDHELAATIATPEYNDQVQNFIWQKYGPIAGVNVTYKNVYDRQMQATTAAAFTGAYAIHPMTNEKLPIYISDYAIDTFEIRKGKTRLGVPAHSSKDFEFAHVHALPIRLVVDVQRHLKGQNDDLGPVVAAPLLDKEGQLTEAYLGEYSPCIVINSDVLNNASLKDAAAYVVDYLKAHAIGDAYTENFLYEYNNGKYCVKDLAKIESALYKNTGSTPHVETLKRELSVALNYIQADFLSICEKFLINVKNTKSLMIALIEEDCQIRNNNDCYLLQWARLPDGFNEKVIFRRDITSVKNFTLFCRDLVNFLSDFAHSCPKALENIRKQN